MKNFFLMITICLLVVWTANAQRPPVPTPFDGGTSSLTGHTSGVATLSKAAGAGGGSTVMSTNADAATWIISEQMSNGGFPWVPGTTPASNITGPIGMGLLRQYQHAGNTTVLNAASAAAGYLVPNYPRLYTDNDPRFATHDPMFLELLSAETGTSTYAAFVQTYFWDKLTAGTYGENNDMDAADYGAAVVSGRSGGGIVELSPWDLSATAIAAHIAGETTSRNQLMAAILDGLEATLTGDDTYDVIGLAGAIWASAVTGIDLNPTSGVHSSASSTADLVTKLLTYQRSSDGAFVWSSNATNCDPTDITNGDAQVTAFAILALQAYNAATYSAQIAHAASFLRSLQQTSGQILCYPTASTTYGGSTEVHGEAMHALVMSAPAIAYVDNTWSSISIGADPDGSGSALRFGYDAFATFAGAQDAVTDGGAVQFMSGTFTGNLTISRGITVQSAFASGTATGAPVMQGLVTVGADDVTIKGLKITNSSGNAIHTAGRSNLAILDNLFEAVGTTSTANVHAITITGSSTASTEILDDILIDGNVFTNIGNASSSNSKSHSAIAVGFSTENFELTNLVIQNNSISDVNAPSKGAYGILLNVGSGSGNGKVTAPIIRNNSISDLLGGWAHAIGLEADTEDAIVEGNEIYDIVSTNTTTPDAAAVFIEKNRYTNSLSINNNLFGPNVVAGVALHPEYFNSAAADLTWYNMNVSVDARNNYWGDNDGPCTSTLYSGPGCTGYGVFVTDDIVFEPWMGQATVMPAATIPNTTMDIGDDDITEFELQYDAVPETGGTIYITTYDTAPAGVTAPVGANVSKYIEITSDMPNGTFGIWITLSVTAGSATGNFLETPADADVKRLAYFNESTNSWVLVSGSYSSLPASTAGVFDNATGTAEFTFFADHFTVFAFIGGSSASYYNTPATAYPLYVAMTPSANLNLASNRTVYPNNTWSGGYPGRTDDWGFSGSQPITVYVVPDNSSTFFSGSTTLQWTNGMLGSTVTVDDDDLTYSGLFTGANRILDSDMLGTSNSIRIDAARSDNTNYDPAVTAEAINTGDFIVKLGLSLLKPGSTGIDVIGADFRRYVNSTTSPQYVYVEPFGTTIKAYLGDVANSSDQTSGDGLIDVYDLNIWSAAYWSGVTGFPGGLTNYKTKFDIGPTADGTPFTLPVPDTKIEFEDLVIFSISYGLSAANALPKGDVDPGTIGLSLGDAVQAGTEIRIPVRMTGGADDVRALKLRFHDVEGRFLGYERGELLEGRENPIPVFTMQSGNALAIDLAVMGVEETPIMGTGELLWLRFDATGAATLGEAEARTSLNRSIRVALQDASVTGFTLDQNYPNPFNPSTTISFTLEADAVIDLAVYNTLGRRVSTILSGAAFAGTQQVTWNGTDDAGNALPSGVYIYRLTDGSSTQQRSMMLAK